MSTSAVIRHQKRGKSVRYLCKSCNKSFSKNYENIVNPKDLLKDFLDGVSIRKLSIGLKGLTPTIVFNKLLNQAKSIPINILITQQYSDMSKFSGKLVFDGTYFPVKPFERELPMIWGIDYDSHDIPHSMLVPSENYLACRKYFSDLKSINYPLKYMVCDDNNNIKRAARDVFPNVVIQTCLKHYLSNIMDDLSIRSSGKYQEFFDEIYDIVFYLKLNEVELSWHIQSIYPKYKDDKNLLFWLTDIMQRRVELTNYHMFVNAPRTTNLIEAYNSHLKDRIDSFRGFKSFKNAKCWLNTYVVYRRLRDLKTCGKKFKQLNGKCSLSNTLKNGQNLPNFF